MAQPTDRADAMTGRDDRLDVRIRELLGQQSALRELAIAVAEMRPPEVIYELVAKEVAASRRR